MAFAIDLHEHLIEVPPPTRRRVHSIHPLLADLGGEDRAEPVPPEPDRPVANLDPTLVKKVLRQRSDSGKRTYIITARRMISGEVLK